MTVTLELLQTIEVIWASLFAVGVLVYASTLYYYDEFKLPRFAAMLVDAIGVNGLSALLYVWLLAGGDEAVRWLVYPLCSCLLLRTAHVYLTCPPGCCHFNVLQAPADSAAMGWQAPVACTLGANGRCRSHQVRYSHAYYAMFVCALVGILAPYAISIITPNAWYQWLIFGLAFIPFVFVGLFLDKETGYMTAAVSPKSNVRWFMYLVAVFWIGYPVVFALSPVMSNVIDANTAAFSYAMLDAVTKVVYSFTLLWSIRKQCGHCEPCACSGHAKKHDDPPCHVYAPAPAAAPVYRSHHHGGTPHAASVHPGKIPLPPGVHNYGLGY